MRKILDFTGSIIMRDNKPNSFWKYEVILNILGKERFLTYADTFKDGKKTALRRFKALLFKVSLPD